ncbi:MAG: glycosyltransferase family 4 protein [Polyangiales bacterium]
MLFVVPGPDAPVSGGNRYNDGVIEALGARRVELAALDARSLEAERVVWLDSLYLMHAPRVRACARRASLGLLAHALPSQLARAEGRADEALEAHERALLALFDHAIAPSETMREWLAERAPALRTSVVGPAVHKRTARREMPLTALMVANLLPNKGVLPFLQALSPRADDAFTLRIVGRVDLDREYAAQCLAYAEPRIVFTDGMPFEALLDEYARAHVLVSASRSESYGMAIAEARASGCLVLARAGGHVARLLDPHDTLVHDDRALAEALLGLVRDPAACARRLAGVVPLPVRGWSEVARELMRV